jgi:hypothetical protein
VPALQAQSPEFNNSPTQNTGYFFFAALEIAGLFLTAVVG